MGQDEATADAGPPFGVDGDGGGNQESATKLDWSHIWPGGKKVDFERAARSAQYADGKEPFDRQRAGFRGGASAGT